MHLLYIDWTYSHSNNLHLHHRLPSVCISSGLWHIYLLGVSSNRLSHMKTFIHHIIQYHIMSLYHNHKNTNIEIRLVFLLIICQNVSLNFWMLFQYFTFLKLLFYIILFWIILILILLIILIDLKHGIQSLMKR